jgi:hypothetical protein
MFGVLVGGGFVGAGFGFIAMTGATFDCAAGAAVGVGAGAGGLAGAAATAAAWVVVAVRVTACALEGAGFAATWVVGDLCLTVVRVVAWVELSLVAGVTALLSVAGAT